MTKIKKILTNELYSLDKLIIEFRINKYNTANIIQAMSIRPEVSAWESKKINTMRFNYSVDIGGDNSFWFGLVAGWEFKSEDSSLCRIEFNPTKCIDSNIFIEYYNTLISYAKHTSLIKPIRFDLAIDIPLDRENIYLQKDQRKYEEYSYSNKNKTQYLGTRNSHGRVKLYNKALEQKIDIPLTRLELTIDYAERDFNIAKKLIPKLILLDNYQMPLDISGTDKVILIACLQDSKLLKELSRRKRDKIEEYIKNIEFNLELDKEKYSTILESIEGYRKPLQKLNYTAEYYLDIEDKINLKSIF